MNPGPKVVTQFMGMPITDTLIVSWVVVILLIIFSKIVTRRLEMVPGRLQSAVELLITSIEDQIETMLPGRGSKFLPFIATIFIYIGVSNIIGVIPGVANPTGDLNTTLGLALVVFLVSQYYGVRKKGLWGYLKGFGEPVVFMLPINIIGELAKPISHSFRLFGNIVAGGILLGIVFQFAPWLIPVPLHAWFDLFIGLVQALIFGMLAIAYISIAES
ncbi:F0F1 ATP synthase subunit A [Halothermothrix orenii]|uniref:ATP synthase subunit a n=1 Tax=Halothermothrix orenii (strain H 168 / OCM 544 / DSM 9562) TaxID=373903 RepID=B8CZ17_HALOH|nr:F0F1 ATP synthase subunit A [Halothermothrix orenii]ACL70536.1 ATP synthase F0, A subunit [Halothermothrix orenii H 168]